MEALTLFCLVCLEQLVILYSVHVGRYRQGEKGKTHPCMQKGKDWEQSTTTVFSHSYTYHHNSGIGTRGASASQ